ncbi:MAG: hypothetical protein ACYDC6_09645 [Acidobacteriaceae bacterium]
MRKPLPNLHSMRGKQGHIQAGGGIVAYSVPEKEYEESINKGMFAILPLEKTIQILNVTSFCRHASSFRILSRGGQALKLQYLFKH